MKFLRGKTWQIILAVCLLVVVLCITASAAASGTGSVTIGSTTYNITEGDEATWRYFTTSTEGVITENGSDSNYNIKFEYPTGGTPTLSLKGAYITDAISSNTGSVDTKIVIEKAGDTTTVPSEAVEDNITPDSYMTGTITWSNGALTVEGEDNSLFKIKRTGTAITITGQSATFKNLDLDISVTNSAQRCIKGMSANVTFVNCTANLYSAASVAYSAENTSATESTSTEITNSNITAGSGSGKAMYIVDPVHTVTVNSGELTVTSASNNASQFNSGSKLEIKGGTVVFSGTATAVAPVLTDYSTYYASVSANADGTGAAKWNGTTALSSYKYFKIEPAYTVTVEGGGTATPSLAPANGTVTLSAPTTSGGSTFAKWTSSSENVTFADPYSANTTFTMPAENVTVTATYGAAASVTIGSTSYQVVQGGKTYYFTTPEGVITADGSANNYNIKFEYPTGGTPTLSLKGAYITDPISSNTGSVDTKIVIEKAGTATTVPSGETADSYLTGGISWENGSLTIEGKDDSVLKIVRAGHGINLKKTTAAFKDLKLDISVTGTNRAIKTTHANVTFDGCDVKLYSATSVAYSAEGTEGTDSTMTMNESKISAESGSGRALYVVDTKHIITVNSGELKVKSASNYAAQFNAANQVKVNGGTVVFSGTTTAVAPVLTDYSTYYVSVSSTATDGITGVAEWNGTTGLNTYKYFKIEPAYTITVVDGTPSRTTAPEGMEVTLTAGTVSGKTFDNWTVQTPEGLAISDASAETTTFTMPASNVSITAIFVKKASVTFGGEDREVIEGGDTYYFTTPDGVITAGGNESTYNIKFVYPTDGTPTLYLKGAYITDPISSNTGSVDTKIVIEKADTTTVPDSVLMADETKPDSYMTGTITWSHSKLEIEGTPGAGTVLGKFKMLRETAYADAVNISGQQVTFKNLNLEITVTQSGQRGIRGTGAKIIFEGGKAVLHAAASPTYGVNNASAIEDQGLVITGADVTISSDANNAIYANEDTNHAITVNSGKLTIRTTSSSPAIRLKSGKLTINGGIVEISGTSGVSQFESLIPTLTDYADDSGDTYYASVSTNANGDSATTYTAGTALDGYKYFKVQPAYKITVNSGEASPSVVPVDGSVTVTLTPNDAQNATQGFAYWASTAFAGGKIYANTYTFSNATAPIEITANYGTLAQVYLNGSGTPYSAVQGGATNYYITEDGTISAGSEGNYNIAFAYPEDDGDNATTELPTLTLKNATLNSTYNYGCIMNGSTTPDLVIEVQGQNNVLTDQATRAAILFEGDNLTIRGVGENKIQMTSNGQTFLMRGGNYDVEKENHTLTLDNVNMVASGAGTGTIRLSKAYDVEVNGGSLDIEATGNGIYFEAAGGTMTVDRAQVSITAAADKVGIYAIGGSITLNGGTANIGTEENPVGTGFRASNVTINGNATVEVFTATSVIYGSVIPDLSGWTCYAAAGAEKATATTYTAGTALSGKYFKVQPAYAITVNGGTASPSVVPVDGSVTVTLTPNDAQDATQGFAYWESTAFAGGKIYANTYTFSNATAPIEITANYGTLAQVYLNGSGTPYSAVQGGATKYYITNDETGAISAGSEGNYNIAFAYPEDDGDDKTAEIPTLTLNNATLITGNPNGCILNDETTPDLVINVKGTENVLTDNGGTAAILFEGDNLTINGEADSKIQLISPAGAAVYLRGNYWDESEGITHTLTLNNVNMVASGAGTGTIRLYKAYDVEVNGGSLDIEATGNGIYFDAGGTMTVEGAQVSITAANDKYGIFGTGVDIILNGGDIRIGTDANKVMYGIRASSVTIKGDATVEIFAEESVIYGDVIPNLNEYVDGEDNPTYSAVAAASRAVFEENPEGSVYTAGVSLSGKLYFLIEPKCVEVTITWGAMTFTYAGSQWNVETLTWEGIWTPTNDPNSPAADMDGYDDTLASNQIKVVNSGTVTVNVSFRFDSDGSFTNSYGTVNGAFKTTSVRKKPYYLSNWDAVDSSQFPYIWNKAYFRAETDANEDITVSYGGKTNIEEIAQALKAKFDTYPDNANMRILNVKSLETQFMVKTADDVIFMEDGTAAMAAWMRVFLAEYSRIGGKLDGVHSDLEYIDGYSQYLYNAYEAGDTGIYDKIVANDAYTSKVRPKLEERGFEFYDGPDSDNEIWSTRFYTDEKYKQCRYIWDVVISNMYADYLTEAFYEPLQEYYPDAWFDDWETRDAYGWMKEIPESGHTMYLGGNYKKAGNYSNYSYYNYAPSTQWVDESESDTTTYMKPTSHNDAVYEDNAFNMTMWEVNTSKNMYAATDTKQIAIHLTFYDWALLHSANGQEGSSNTPYHVESYFHSGLLDPLFGGYFILKEASGEPDVEEDTDAAAYALRLQVASEILAELNRVAGYADRKPIETPANWNDSFILSGMYAGGRNIWRITPDTITGVSRETFLLYENENEVVFYNKGQRITFPQGNIIADSVISEVGTCGYWVETPADVMPIVTNEADRYEEYPAYVETFDNYTVDEAFSSQYSHTWELGDSSATIQQNGDDKFLAIQGNATLNNVKLPEYITAGDNYAKQQAWELSFRLSALPSGNGELKLLTASSGGSNADGGFCISNNTLYYSTASGYQAFNITLDDNTEYTVKRVFDFRTVNSFTCSYYVYDANGELLGNAEDVVISSLSLPVQKIGISTANFGSNTLYVDDYKLYATGVTTDLEVYNADTGIQVDASVPREGNTAYRLSWMNASSDTKIYNVVATYSDGTKEILNSIEMLPGCDGVNTGIVKVNDKSVTISLEETDTKVPDAGDNAGDDGSSNGSNSASGEATTITLIRFQEADAYLYLSSGYVATFNERKTLGTVTVVIDALSPAQGGNA